MALSTADGQSHPNTARGIDTIGEVLKTRLLLVHAGLGIQSGIAVKAGGGKLRGGGVWEEITCDLLNGELVEGEITIDGVDHPVTILPSIWPHGITQESIAVGITCHVQPVTRPAFSKVGRGQKTVNKAEIGQIRVGQT